MAKKSATFSVDSYPYVECREQHHWQPYDGAVDAKAKLAYRVQKCANCPTKKHSTLSMRAVDYGQTVRSYYHYPTDYRVPGGMDTAVRGQIRMHNFLIELGGNK